MILVTTDFVSGKEIETIAMVKGSTVHSKNIGKDIMSSLKTIVGGEIVSYTEMMDEARAIATKRMVDEAMTMGADAIVSIRFASSAVMQGASEIMAYGTAVKFK
ncbi:MAG: YbjQ family protein [Angelakisella sp.]|nr:YbjQ family protein [Angelakisella sp.]